MRFLHTADWQIGMKASGLGLAAALVRQERFKSARRVIEAAQREKVEFILIVGDTFENNSIDRGLVREVIDILATAKLPVFVLPGNHDPFCAGSVWEMREWREQPDIHILDIENIAVTVPGATLYPCPIRERHGVDDKTTWIPHTGDGIRIGIAHGSVEGLAVDEFLYPIPRITWRLGTGTHAVRFPWVKTHAWPTAEHMSRPALENATAARC
jgi:hypothetical protein